MRVLNVQLGSKEHSRQYLAVLRFLPPAQHTMQLLSYQAGLRTLTMLPSLSRLRFGAATRPGFASMRSVIALSWSASTYSGHVAW